MTGMEMFFFSRLVARLCLNECGPCFFSCQSSPTINSFSAGKHRKKSFDAATLQIYSCILMIKCQKYVTDTFFYFFRRKIFRGCGKFRFAGPQDICSRAFCRNMDRLPESFQVVYGIISGRTYSRRTRSGRIHTYDKFQLQC